MVEDLAEDQEDPVNEVMIFVTPVLKAATRNRQKVRVPIKIRIFLSVIVRVGVTYFSTAF